MSWGFGQGSPWGSGPLVTGPNQLAQVAGDPVSFVFTDEDDGPLPGSWEFYQLLDTAGVKTGDTEPSPELYYRIQGGFGLWDYTRSPLTGDPYLEQGVAASPSATLEGRNARVAAYFVSPLSIFDNRATSFVFEIIVGVRLVDAGVTYVGGRVQALWSTGGGWAPAIAVEAVQAAGAAPTVLSTATLPETSKETDLWAASDQHELEVDIREGEMTVTFDGHVQTSAVVPGDGPAKAVLIARTYNLYGTTFDPRPALVGMQLLSLRDAERLGPAADIAGDLIYENHQLPLRELPATVLLDGTLWKRVGARVFVALSSQAHDVGGNEYSFDAGDAVRVTERIRGQFLLPIVPDLAYIRGRRGR